MEIELLTDDKHKKEIMKNHEKCFLKSDQNRHTELLYEKICKNALFFIARENDIVCGFCAVYANDYISKEAYITLIAVNPLFQRKGIGQKLIKKAIEKSAENGMITCKLEVNKENTKAIDFYNKNGFFTEEYKESGIILCKRINEVDDM